MRNLRKGHVGFAVAAVGLSCVGLGAAKGCQLRQESAGEERAIGGVRTTDWYTVRNEEQVLAKVAEIGGVPKELLEEATVKLVSLKEDNTPFLSDQIIGPPLWKVTIPKWKLELPSAIPGFEDRYERTFDILVDPVNGNILKIVSRWPEDVPDMAPEPAADSAEVQMINSGLERYHSFPHDRPAISFLQALDVVLRDGSGSPLVAKQIIAHYVVQSKMGGEPRPVWAISLRGIHMVRRTGPPGPPGGPRADYKRVIEMMRNIVDARTGAWVGASNSPQPIYPAEPKRTPPGIPSPPPTVTLDLSSPSDGQAVVPGSIIDWTITATVSTGDNFGLSLVAVDLVQDPDNPELFDIPPGVRPASMEDFDRPNGISNPDPGGPGSAYGGTQIGTPGAMDLAQIGGAQNTFGVVGDGIGLDTQVDTGVGQSPGGEIIATGEFNAPCTPGLYIFSIESAIANVLEEVRPAPQFSLVRSGTVIIRDGSFGFNVTGSAPCPWDLDGDGGVGILDLLALLAAWGTDPGGPPDFDGDGNVGILDLLALLANWGNCPCVLRAEPPPFEQVLEDAGLSEDDFWNILMPIMEDGTQEERDNALCWFARYIKGCPEDCSQLPACPANDPFNECPGDLNGDCTVDSWDLTMLLGCWGTPCGDLNGDCTTDSWDLTILLANWGPCPQPPPACGPGPQNTCNQAAQGGDGGGSGTEGALQTAVMQLGFDDLAHCRAWLAQAEEAEALACGYLILALLSDQE